MKPGQVDLFDERARVAREFAAWSLWFELCGAPSASRVMAANASFIESELRREVSR